MLRWREWSPQTPTEPSGISPDPTGIWGFILIVGYKHWLPSGHSLKSAPVDPSWAQSLIREYSSHSPGHTLQNSLWPPYVLRTSDLQSLSPSRYHCASLSALLLSHSILIRTRYHPAEMICSLRTKTLIMTMASDDNQVPCGPSVTDSPGFPHGFLNQVIISFHQTAHTLLCFA